ncbi:hypothetical protein D3C80_2107660 [compost metagenome]
MRRGAEQRLAPRHFDQPAGIHHHHPVNQVAHHGQVVRHVQRCHAVAPAQVFEGFQHMRLGGDVKRSGGLVEHNQFRP